MWQRQPDVANLQAGRHPQGEGVGAPHQGGLELHMLLGDAPRQTKQSKTRTLCRPRLLASPPTRVSMLTRRANRVRDLRQAALSRPLLGPLPGDLVKLILRLLPLDARLRAREVRRGWCALLEDASFWTHINLNKSCGVNPRFFWNLSNVSSSTRRVLALLRAAGVRAQGKLLSADLSGVIVGNQEVLVLQWADVLSAANKASLRDLVAPTTDLLETDEATELCRALPLCRVRCDVRCKAVEALPLLRREPPYELLTIRELGVYRNTAGLQALLDLASALAGYKGMKKLRFKSIPLAIEADVNALTDAAISAGIVEMEFSGCGLSQTALPALTRLVQSPGFECLSIDNDAAIFEGPAMPAFCEALRNCKNLKNLELHSVNLWADTAALSQLIAALESLPALHELNLRFNSTDEVHATQQASGECLARLIARSSSLRVLILSGNALGEAGLAPIFEALRNSSSLLELWIREQVSADFVRNAVLPAVREYTSLRLLFGLCSDDGEPLPSMTEVEDILTARRLAEGWGTLPLLVAR